MAHIMLDLETMSARTNASIVAIGACVFGASGIGAKFYQSVDLESCEKLGLDISASTVIWWMGQSKEAQNKFLGATVSLVEALVDFNTWMKEQGERHQVWGNGAAFDNVILRNAYEVCDMKTPWSHWDDRCYRTMKNERKDITHTREGTHHSAIDDAVFQAEHLLKIWKA